MDLIIESIENRWLSITYKITYKLSKIEFIKAVRLVFSSTFFSFNNKICKQSFGVRIDVYKVVYVYTVYV